ncbi:MAG: nickel-responsive regulator [Elusimicrobia bacterium RIFOXYB2_FULL_49_7]|nr:MAG: nickel-responsive regulator [Elusimicrobia bacterium RIFOXYB2_FULL_49_7]
MLIRFGVSIEKDLLDKFDAVIRGRDYPTRSKAIEDFIRQAIIESEISKDTAEVVGSIDIVYDHHKREVLNKLTDIQHDFQDVILSSQHIHLNHHDCFEIVIVKGGKRMIEKLANRIKAAKGVKQSSLRIAGA